MNGERKEPTHPNTSKGTLSELPQWKKTHDKHRTDTNPMETRSSMANLQERQNHQASQLSPARITQHLDTYKLLSSNQNGFRRNRSTHMQIMALKTLTQHAATNSKEIHIIYVDLTGAFDSVPHSLIPLTLEKYGVSEKIVTLLNNLYTTKGTHQGDPGSPLIFNMMLDPILGFADDIVLVSDSQREITEMWDTFTTFCYHAGRNPSI